MQLAKLFDSGKKCQLQQGQLHAYIFVVLQSEAVISFLYIQ